MEKQESANCGGESRISNEVTLSYEGGMLANAEFPNGDIMTINALSCGGGASSCGGGGAGPSPKDVFAASYGSCVIMVMDIAAKKAGFDISGAKIIVSPVWSKKEPVLEEISSRIVLVGEYSDEQKEVMKKASHYCPIHNSLRAEAKTSMTFEAATH
jgi:putative redox protein